MSIPKNENDTLIVSFAGQGFGYGGIAQFEFVNFLNAHYKDYDKRFYLDRHRMWYHRGIDEVSNDIAGTLSYLAEQIKPYKRVIFIGSSAGGYAAILFGSLLAVDTVIAFRPQTNIANFSKPYLSEPQYHNLRGFINTTTKYHLYADPADQDPYHRFSHCENVEVSSNVNVVALKGLDMKTLRDEGHLLQIFRSIII